MNIDYILRDEETEKLIVTVDFGGYIIVKFDRLRVIKPETYEVIDEIKSMKTDIGYCKGFKPRFRPLPGHLADDVLVNPEIIYLVSDSSENLDKFRQFISQRLHEIEPDFELEFGLIAPQEF